MLNFDYKVLMFKNKTTKIEIFRMGLFDIFKKKSIELVDKITLGTLVQKAATEPA
jgi:hypothetical protein